MATLNLSKMKYMSEANLKKFASLIISLSSQVTDVENKCIKPYVGGELYQKDSYVSYNGYIYQATATNQDSAFDETHWDKLSDDFNELTVADIEAMLGLSQEQLETMANLIADTEVRLDKTYSSSKIYQDTQQCLNDSKAFTLLELGKFSGASYKVVASTSEMTSESIIYLLASGNTYDMYIVEEDGTTTKIGDMDVNLDDYYTKAEIEADYLKKADADGKYATIVTVDSKVDKDKIVTVLDDTVTDDEVASAKAVYETTKYNNIKTFITLNQLGLNDGCDVAEIVNAMPEHSYAEIGCYNAVNSYGLEIVTGLPNEEANFILTIRKYNYHRVDIQAKSSASGVVKNDLYIGGMVAGGTSVSWKRLCSTTVADVPETRIIPTDATGFPYWSNAYYSVKNGICHVCLWGIVTTITESFVKTGVVLPKPLFVGAGTFLTGSGTGAPSGFAYVEQHDSILTLDGVIPNTSVFGVFSYPVAE